ncbi:hypothetical protein BDV29DRAFT_197328 [Aspergillus leporis]|uniref:Uncharacterized protein n=1 Tax=Aspergillus leporis TaxID=41062 RepID=A0A5N5WWL9_9EURO|nr:hypothetical protein BDV29DRAFT_197328 [Aspergillus leporis]
MFGTKLFPVLSHSNTVLNSLQPKPFCRQYVVAVLCLLITLGGALTAMSATPAPKLFLGTVRGHTFQELISIMKSPCGTTAAEARARGCHGLYVNWEYHVQHCTQYIGPYSHTQHCEKMLLRRGEGYAMSDINTHIRVKFPDYGIK